MENLPITVTEHSSAGEAAVDGLGNGLLAGIFMGVYLLSVGLLDGLTATATAARFATIDSSAPALTGTITHLATAAVYGALFGVAWYVARPGRFTRRRLPAALLAGLTYGLLLLLLARTLIGGAADGLFAFGTAHAAAAHLLYGLILGWRMGRA